MRALDLLRGALGEVVEVAELALGDAQHLEPVERGRARACLLDVDARIREHDATRGGADREAEREALVGRAVVVGGQIGAEARARVVEEERILDDLLREDLLGEAGDEDHVEGEAARLLDRLQRTPCRSAGRTGARRAARGGARARGAPR